MIATEICTCHEERRKNYDYFYCLLFQNCAEHALFQKLKHIFTKRRVLKVEKSQKQFFLLSFFLKNGENKMPNFALASKMDKIKK